MHLQALFSLATRPDGQAAVAQAGGSSMVARVGPNVPWVKNLDAMAAVPSDGPLCCST